MTVAALVLALVRPGAAQPAGAQAEVLFRQGRDLLAAGKIAEACSAFQESQRLDPVVTTLMNLANCRQKEGLLATAWGLFLEVERQTRTATDDNGKQLHEVALRLSAKLEPRVSKLTIGVPAASRIEGLEVLRDGVAITSIMWNRALPLDGGTYSITARAPGATAWSTKVTLSLEGDNKAVEIPSLVKSTATTTTTTSPVVTKTEPTRTEPPRTEPVPATPPVTGIDAPPATVVVTDSGTTMRSRIPLVLGGTALVLGGVALGFNFWGDSTYDDAKAEMTDQARRDALYESANHKRWAAEGFAVASVIAVGVAVWIYVIDRKPSSSATATRAVTVSPTGLAVVGTF